MRLWIGELRKDIELMRSFAIVSIVCVVVVGLLLIIPTYRQNPGHFSGLGTIVLGMVFIFEMICLPVHLVISIVREWRGTAGFWLQSPQSGWALIASKTIAGCLWTIALEVVTSILLFWSLSRTMHIIRDSTSPAEWFHLHWIVENQYRIGMYFIIGVLLVGLVAGFWLTFICMAMRSVRYRMKGLPWIAALVVFLIWTWGLSALQHTAIYHRIFDFGKLSISWLRLLGASDIPATVQQPMIHLYAGHLLWNVLILAGVFYLSGWLLDKRVEI